MIKRPPTMLPAARQAALQALEITLPLSGRQGSDIQAALDSVLSTQCPDPRDKRLTTELVYGYCRFRSRLTFVADHLMAKRARTAPFIRRVLCIAIYELLFLDSVPNHATLSWAVDAVKNPMGERMAGLVNAVLRRCIDLRDGPRMPDFYRQDNCTEEMFLSRWHACPEWIVHLWRESYGPELAGKMLVQQASAPLHGVRVNALRHDAKALFDRLAVLPGVAFSMFPCVAFKANASPEPTTTNLLESQGALSRQSFGVHALLTELNCGSWPDPIWDACCGRGGKTTALLEQGHTQIWASDPNRRRLAGLKREIIRLDLPRIPLFRADAGNVPLKNKPATILLDAPCSGLGVLSRRPDTKWKRNLNDLTVLAGMQRRMLTAAVDALPSGGTLVYMTCTANPGENDMQGEFLDSVGMKLKEFAPVNPESGLREWFWGGVWKKS